MRPIDADVLKANINTAFWSEIEKIIDSAPTIDAVEVVRCKECKHGEYREDYDDYLCLDDGICVHDADWFCADGERKESER